MRSGFCFVLQVFQTHDLLQDCRSHQRWTGEKVTPEQAVSAELHRQRVWFYRNREKAQGSIARRGERSRFALSQQDGLASLDAHLSDDEAAAKMGHRRDR